MPTRVLAQGPRSRWRAYLLLSRLSNLPTVWSNVLAGSAIAALPVAWSHVAGIAAAMSLAYTGGMFLNDAFDAPHDRRAQPSRPIAAGDVTRSEVFVGGTLLLGAGVAIATAYGAGSAAALLALAIVVYDARHKGVALAPVVMGLCRALVYVVAATSLQRFDARVAVAAGVIALYVASLTIVAKRVGPAARAVVPILIAGIAVVDAVLIVAFGGGWPVALVAVCCAPATLILQRVVPGD